MQRFVPAEQHRSGALQPWQILKQLCIDGLERILGNLQLFSQLMLLFHILHCMSHANVVGVV